MWVFSFLTDIIKKKKYIISFDNMQNFFIGNLVIKLKPTYKTIETIQKSNIKIVEKDQIDSLTHKYMTDQCNLIRHTTSF